MFRTVLVNFPSVPLALPRPEIIPRYVGAYIALKITRKNFIMIIGWLVVFIVPRVRRKEQMPGVSSQSATEMLAKLMLFIGIPQRFHVK